MGLASAVSRIIDHAKQAMRGVFAQGQGYGAGYGFGVPVLSGVTVTPETALGLTAYYCGVNTIATDVAKLPFSLYQQRRGGGQKVLTSDPRHVLVNSRPNGESNAMRRRQAEVGHAVGRGNSYTWIKRDRDGMPVALWPLHPGNTLPMRDQQTKSLYYEDTQSHKKYRAEDILHIAGLGFDGLLGYSPVMLHRQAVGLGMAAEQFGASLFGNGAIPKGVLKHPKRLTADAAKRLRDTFYEMHGGPQNAHRTAVLEEGADWINTQINPDDAQFLATRQFQVIEIARMLNLPPHKLQDYTQSHHTNVEEANLDYLTSTLTGWLNAIESEYNIKLLFDDEREKLFFHHDLDELLRGNSAARGAFYKTLFTVGAINPNEIRAIEGMNPIPGGDQYLVQAQYVPLDQAGVSMLGGKGADSPPPDKPNPDDPNANEPPAKK